uniref:Uncharacterized protein n=1 Tax=Rhizophagus irregularis (strain DAOM 181602 / DAOM 197198 / MUCL 43194) TaxID=747089 RepID=U9TNX2_RHIID
MGLCDEWRYASSFQKFLFDRIHKRRIRRRLRIRLNPITRQIRQLPIQNIYNVYSFENQLFNGTNFP